MSLTARHLEANGIPTVVLGSARDIVEQAGVARFLFTDFPLGNPAGAPFDTVMQCEIAGMALTLLETAVYPGTTVQTPFHWATDEWRRNFMYVDDSMRAALPSLEAAEAFFPEGVDLVLKHSGASPPFAKPAGCYVLVECAARRDESMELAEVLSGCGAIQDSALATDAPGRARLWAYRERHTESINAEGVPHKLDVTLPLSRLPEFEQRVRGAITAVVPEARPVLFGHAGDGNLHVNILGLEPDDERADDAVLRLVASLGGSISAEHGIGIAKRPWLSLTRSPEDIAAMRAIKRALDPNGLLNPGVILPPE